MISSLQITNFQSHEETTLELHEGVNAIVGATDSGKSSIIRAATLLIKNRPSGDAFRSEWGGETKIKFTLPNGDFIARTKGKENTYSIGTKAVGETDVFSAMKTDVPEEIEHILNIQDINFQFQHD